MIGGNDLDPAGEQRLPELLRVVRRLERRIHLDQRTEPSVVVDVEEQMMRTDLGGDQVVMVGQQCRFGAGRDMQHVEPMLVPHGQIDRPTRGDQRGLVIADPRMVRDIV